MGIISNLALTQMAGYYISKGKIRMATECLIELETELNKELKNNQEKGELENEKTILKNEEIKKPIETKINNKTYIWR